MVTVTPAWLGGGQSNSFHYFWNHDESTVSDKPEPFVFLLDRDTAVHVKAVDSRGCVAMDSITVRALPVPNAKIIPFDTEQSLRCISETWVFSASETSEKQYILDFGDGTLSTQTSPVKTCGGDRTATYTVILDFITKANLFHQLPQALKDSRVSKRKQMKIFFKILLFIVTVIISTVEDIKSSTVTTVLREETSSSFFQKPQYDVTGERNRCNAGKRNG